MAVDADSVTLAKAGGKPQKRPRNTFSVGDQKLLELLSPADANQAEPAQPAAPNTDTAKPGAKKP